ncbi:NfeD family protein [Peptostreptococcus equinus]|uniref:NfeD family protein n=1 Tax=Peptostreptococcus equinus TaxID=3003601 RepID=A0ABY7JQ77_9FIRM|nr:NfeD family protein [Peptostreptococcus sp. CBA3647]WAW15507.1 NfeD family protein [Peptostreptococcus sp. CBA3647]
MFGLSMRIIWIIIAIAFGIIEAATLSLTMIWFSIGAVAAIITSYFTDNILIQLFVFAIVSGVFLYFATKKLIKIDRDKNNTHWAGIDTNADAFIGKKGYVVKTISPKEFGIVKVKGEEWTAVSLDQEQTIESDQEIIVRGIQGVKLIVEKV